ncbi:N-6 DNA methylase [Lachnospiraceae bacterium 54-53]
MGEKIEILKVKEFAINASRLIGEKALEDVLRHNLSTWMPLMFPDNPWWISVHVSGTETRLNYKNDSGSNRGFVDSLVGKTVIEYEKNLEIKSIFKEGYNQVKDYSSALLNTGVLEDDIIGILSDTVNWYAYKVRRKDNVEKNKLLGREDVDLTELEYVKIQANNEISLEKFADFIIKYFGREGSRKLNAESLASDMGLESIFCREHLKQIRKIVNNAFENDEKYAELIKKVWTNFVSYLGGSQNSSTFDIESYINEFYIMTLAKYLCANILAKKSIITDEEQSLNILDGTYFKTLGISNLVEYDYFGWVNNTPYAEKLLPIIRSIQHDLAAYDFTHVVSEDIFGRLVAQLAKREQRVLLGQEYTPQWLAERIVRNTINKLEDSDDPRFLDMCCGSGVFIIETLKYTIERNGIDIDNCTVDDIELLQQSIVGFDIDPLAVMLAKINWVLTMKDFIISAKTDLVVPIFHADSLFITTPITHGITKNYANDFIELNIDKQTILLPGFLLTPHNGNLFDCLIRKCYTLAMRRATNNVDTLQEILIHELVTKVLKETGYIIDEKMCDEINTFCFKLVDLLEYMQRNGKNGIWAFVLSNTYRPALVKGQFNGIVSNPPWMTMSKIEDNPYSIELSRRAESYKIKPKGSSHLHIEMATVFLLHGIEQYLSQDAVIGCILPDSVLNGYHHEPFRRQAFESAFPSVFLDIDEIWEIDVTTFKNRAITIFGRNIRNNRESVRGTKISKSVMKKCTFRKIYQGKRSAWTANSKAKSIDEVYNQIPFLQGADIMPRTLVFHNCVKQPNGKWTLSPINRKNDKFAYLVSDAKKYKEFELNAVNFDDKYIYDCYLSNHLTPFFLTDSAKALIPFKKDEEQNWTALSEADLVLLDESTRVVFESILKESKLTLVEYCEKLNYRNKINPQIFPREGFLVLVGASGSYVCAAYVDLEKVNREKLIIDQTFYWHIAKSENEAIYITGLLNSEALGSSIAEFQPEGIQGKRHIHKLPYIITPPFDSSNDLHLAVVENTKALLNEWKKTSYYKDNIYMRDPNSSNLQNRRRYQREQLKKLGAYRSFEMVCGELYGLQS